MGKEKSLSPCVARMMETHRVGWISVTEESRKISGLSGACTDIRRPSSVSGIFYNGDCSKEESEPTDLYQQRELRDISEVIHSK